MAESAEGAHNPANVEVISSIAYKKFNKMLADMENIMEKDPVNSPIRPIYENLALNQSELKDGFVLLKRWREEVKNKFINAHEERHLLKKSLHDLKIKEKIRDVEVAARSIIDSLERRIFPACSLSLNKLSRFHKWQLGFELLFSPQLHILKERINTAGISVDDACHFVSKLFENDSTLVRHICAKEDDFYVDYDADSECTKKKPSYCETIDMPKLNDEEKLRFYELIGLHQPKERKGFDVFLKDFDDEERRRYIMEENSYFMFILTFKKSAKIEEDLPRSLFHDQSDCINASVLIDENLPNPIAIFCRPDINEEKAREIRDIIKERDCDETIESIEITEVRDMFK